MKNHLIKVKRTANKLGRFTDIYYPVLDMDGEEFYCTCLTGNKDTDFQPIVNYLQDLIWKQFRVPYNYGLYYFVSGYNSKDRDEFIKTCCEKFGVDVF